MKKIILIVGLILIVFASAHNTILAGGDQVQGDKGEGVVVQDGPCPFGDPDETSPGPQN